jgi:DHA1 family bicyclomycin/chloramphenicol resistance-like MFS transporter
MTEKALSPWIIVLLAAMIATTPLAIDMYLPAMPAMAQDMDTHIGSVQQSLSIFLAAYGIGMLLFGPLADALGRRPLALFGLSGFALASIALSYVDSIEWFLTWRTIQALSGAASSVVVPGIIRHLYREHTAKGMSYMSMIMMLAPLLAPTIGSAILWLSSWRLIFIVQALYAGLVMAFTWRFLPEINAQNHSRQINFLQGYRTVFSHRSAQPLIATIMFSAFAFFCFLTAMPFIYIKFFGVSEQHFGLLFGMNVMVLMFANFINSRVVTRVGSPRMLRIGLVFALISVSLLCLFNFLQLGLWYTVLTIAPLMASLGLITTNTDAMIIMKFPDHSGTATAVVGTLRFGSGALAGPLLAWSYTGTALPFSLLMLTGVMGILACQGWMIWRNKTLAQSQ